MFTEEMINGLPGVAYLSRTPRHVTSENGVYALLRDAGDAGLFGHPVEMWRAHGRDDRFVDVLLTINLGDGVQLCAPPLPLVGLMPGPERRGVNGALYVLNTAGKAVWLAVNGFRNAVATGKTV